MPLRLAVVTVLSTITLILLGAPAGSHVELDPGEAQASSTEVLTFTVQHGQDGAPTVGLVVQIPAGAAVTEVPTKDGWASEVDEDESTVSWTGGMAPGEESFTVVVRLPSTPGEVLFPTLQETEAGELAWISEGEGEGETESPAPRLTVVADPSATSTTTSTTEPTATTSTGSDLPGTTLEAQERDDGNTSAAPWLIGSGIAALAAIGIGGTLLKRRMG